MTARFTTLAFVLTLLSVPLACGDDDDDGPDDGDAGEGGNGGSSAGSSGRAGGGSGGRAGGGGSPTGGGGADGESGAAGQAGGGTGAVGGESGGGGSSGSAGEGGGGGDDSPFTPAQLENCEATCETAETLCEKPIPGCVDNLCAGYMVFPACEAEYTAFLACLETSEAVADFDCDSGSGTGNACMEELGAWGACGEG